VQVTIADPSSTVAWLRTSRRALTVGVALLVFWLAYDSGTYGLADRSVLAILLWWLIITAIGLGLWPRERIPSPALGAVALLAGFALWTGMSIAWSPSAEAAFEELNRVTLLLGVLIVAVAGMTRATAGRVLDGVAIGLVAIAVTGLASRCFPDLFSERGLETFLPSDATRLSFPVGYWNGLGILLALAAPLVLRAAVMSRSSYGRALAVGSLPALAATLFLTSSRGGVLVAIVGAGVFIVLSDTRWESVAALAVGGAASAGAIAILLVRPELVDGPLDSAEATSQGRSAAALILLLCLLAAGAWAFAWRMYPRGARPPRHLGWAAVAVVVGIVLVGLPVLDPSERLDEFKALPSEDEFGRGFATGHLASGSGSGRWQFWAAAVDQFEEHPLLGDGAGSFETWWAQHASFGYFVRDAHSLYLEALGELGLLGLLLVAGIVSLGLGAGTQRALRETGEPRLVAAAGTATFAAFAVGAGIDWIWELAAVSGLGIFCLGLLTGPATASTLGPSGGTREVRPLALRAAVLVAAALVVCMQAIALFADQKVRASQRHARAGDIAAATDDARAAKSLQPWAATPRLQLALLAEQRGDLASARLRIGEAIERDSRDWRLWLIRARLETKAGAIVAARRSLARARALSPRFSPSAEE
jgi:O-Antigen ligase